MDLVIQQLSNSESWRLGDLKKVQQPKASNFSFKKNITFAPQNQALMSKHNLQIEEKILKTVLKAKSLTYIAITPPLAI